MFGLNKPRSKFGKYLDSKGIKQQWIANESGISHGTISQLAVDDDRVPNYRNAQKIEKTLKKVDPSFSASDFWSI